MHSDLILILGGGGAIRYDHRLRHCRTEVSRTFVGRPGRGPATEIGTVRSALNNTRARTSLQLRTRMVNTITMYTTRAAHDDSGSVRIIQAFAR